MRYAFFIVFFVAVIGSMFVGRAGSSAPVTSIASATSAPGSAAGLYSKNCASCHGRDGRAKTFKAKRNHARNLSDPEWQDKASDERIFNSIMNGKGKMPAYAKKLSAQEIDSLVPYIRGLKK
jgi:cytochrome c6